jgi:hypothetical protein
VPPPGVNREQETAEPRAVASVGAWAALRPEGAALGALCSMEALVGEAEGQRPVVQTPAAVVRGQVVPRIQAAAAQARVEPRAAVA